MMMVLKWIIYNDLCYCKDGIGMDNNDVILQCGNGIMYYLKYSAEKPCGDMLYNIVLIILTTT